MIEFELQILKFRFFEDLQVQEVHNSELGFCRLRSGEEPSWNPAKYIIVLSHGD
jgi:hypothetical protein